MDDDSMDLICFKYDGWGPRIRPASPKRQWMEETGERYAYRCLPLAIANAHGWELLSPVAFEARWGGGIEMESVEIRMDPGYETHLKPVSLFGYGTMTFHIEGIFRTPPGWNLWVSGSPNNQKDGIQALGGVIETDWSPYTFTMNWRFTRPNHWVRFEENEPIAFIFPIERGRVESFSPRIERLEGHAELRRQFETWSKSRDAFQKWVLETNPPAPADKWQKLYYRGLDADGKPGPADHQSKLRVQPFRNPDGSVMAPGEAKACPMRHGAVRAPAIQASAQNVLFAQGSAAGGANPGLSLALSRIGFDARPEPGQAALQLPRRTDPAVERAVKRRDWLLDVQMKQRRLSSRSAGIERVANLSGDGFLERFYAPAWPVVIEGAMAGWQALERWTPDYLTSKLGAAMSEGGASDPAARQLKRDLGSLDDYLTRDQATIAVEPIGTLAPLRFEPINLLLAQVVGIRRFILASPSETRRLYNLSGTSSEVHDLTDQERLDRFPIAREAQTFEVELSPGELLYLPVGWWHQSIALDYSASVSFSSFRWPNEGQDNFPQD